MAQWAVRETGTSVMAAPPTEDFIPRSIEHTIWDPRSMSIGLWSYVSLKHLLATIRQAWPRRTCGDVMLCSITLAELSLPVFAPKRWPAIQRVACALLSACACPVRGLAATQPMKI